MLVGAESVVVVAADGVALYPIVAGDGVAVDFAAGTVAVVDAGSVSSCVHHG